jgi:ABC-2 type transport system ATP-binding protein
VDVGRDPEGVKRRIGYMSQRFSLYELLTVDQNISFFGGVYGLDGAALAGRRKFVIEMAGLAGRENTLARDLAGGWRQRLALGCAILHEPAILFLDEPTGGVDPLSRRQFWRLIDALSLSGVTVLVTTHYLDEAERCHRVALIHAGRLAAIGTPGEVKRIFAGRPILEVRSPRSVDAMRLLDSYPEIEKTSLFGTAVHAVLRNDSVPPVSTSRVSRQSCRRSKTCSSTSSIAKTRGTVRREPGQSAGRLSERTAADFPRSPHAHDHRLRARILPAPLRLRPQLGYSPHRAGGAGS